MLIWILSLLSLSKKLCNNCNLLGRISGIFGIHASERFQVTILSYIFLIYLKLYLFTYFLHWLFCDKKFSLRNLHLHPYSTFCGGRLSSTSKWLVFAFSKHSTRFICRIPYQKILYIYLVSTSNSDIVSASWSPVSTITRFFFVWSSLWIFITLAVLCIDKKCC